MCNDVLLPALAPSPSIHLRVFIKDLAISFVICFSGLELPFFSSVLFPVLLSIARSAVRACCGID